MGKDSRFTLGELRDTGADVVLRARRDTGEVVQVVGYTARGRAWIRGHVATALTGGSVVVERTAADALLYLAMDDRLSVCADDGRSPPVVAYLDKHGVRRADSVADVLAVRGVRHG